MEDNDKNSQIIKAFIKNEEVLSDLYAKYAERFPNDLAFWMEISKDETVHASWVYDLYEKYKNGSVIFKPERFNIVAINTMIKYIVEQADKLSTENISSIQALSISMDIENSMIERNLFESYDTDDIEISKVLNRLRISTEIHYAEVKEKLQSEKQAAAAAVQE
jgi:rubrerythrin